MQIRKDIQSLKDEVIKHRRYFHQNPEIHLNTPNSAKYIMDALYSYGYTNIDYGMAENGVVASIQVNDGDYISFRADMDALAMVEETGLAYASTNGYAHACGHDGHTAALLGFAKYVKEHEASLKQNVCFIFQPGEEAPGGAEMMIKDGLFKKYPTKAIFGTHLMSEVMEGKVVSKSGPLMARNGEIHVKITGKGAHGAMPHLGKDAIVAGSAFVGAVQTIVSRNVSPVETAVISIGSFHGGFAENIIAEVVAMEGTIRAFNDEVYNLIVRQLKVVGEGIAKSFGVDVEVIVDDMYYAVSNDNHLFQVLEDVMADELQEGKLYMASEDFSFYQREVPGLFYYVGTQSEDYPYHLHNNKFNFNEEVLLTIIEVNARLLEKVGASND